jgi:hypothetical protein
MTLLFRARTSIHGLNVAGLLSAIALTSVGCAGEPEQEEHLEGLTNFDFQAPRGDANCAYGSADCNTCVNDVRGSFRAIANGPTAQIRYKSRGGSNLPPSNRKLEKFDDNDSHVQSIVRLPGVGPDLDPNGKGPWFALSRANPGSVGGSGIFLVQLADLPTHGGFSIETSARGEPPSERGTKAYYPIEGLDHAGGMQAIGSFTVSASSCDKADKCGSNGYMHTFNFANPTNGVWVNALRVGDQGEPGNTGTVTSAAMAKLASGQHLLFVLGKDTAHEGWFYVSDGSGLAPDSVWRYSGHWHLPLGGANEYQNTQLVTECGTGDLYMVGSGNADYDGKLGGGDILQTALNTTPGNNHLSLLKLVPSNNAVAGMEFVDIRQLSPGNGEYCTFRAGASVHVTPDHRMALYCTTRKANEDLRGNADSKLKMEEYAPR